MNGMATACKEGGAVDLLDIAKLPENAAQAVLQTVVMTYVKGDQGSGSVYPVVRTSGGPSSAATQQRIKPFFSRSGETARR